jgi:GNAT superfamily N-acetyltransferase
MAGIRDDSAGNYGQWDSSDLSWLDFIKATGSDVGNGAYNALSNITGALSPIGTSPEGNMSLQVPPMITGIADSYRRLSDPTGPGNAYRLTGVPELDAPIQKDMSDVLLSFTGGQAIGGLGRAALPKRGMNRIERTVTDYDFPMYRMTDNAGTEIARAQFDELPNAVRVKDLFVDPSHRGQGVASTLYGHIQDDLVKPMTPDYTLTPDGFEFWKNSYPEAVADYRFDGQTYRQPGPLRAGAETGAVESYRMSGGPNRDSNVLWSDTGRPSIFGSAVATAGEQPRNALGAGAMREAVEQQPVRAYRGVSRDQFAGAADQPVWLSSSPDVASSYAGSYPFDPSPSVYPADLEFRNPMTFDAQGGGWGELNVGGKYMDSDELAALARSRGHDGLIMKNVVDGPDGVGVPQATTYAALRRNTVKSPLTGETLFSDTGKPSIFGSAAATAGELPMDPASRMARAKEMGFDTDTTWFHGTPEKFDAFSPEQEIWLTSDIQTARNFGKDRMGLSSPQFGYSASDWSAADKKINVVNAHVRGKILDVDPAAEAALIAREIGVDPPTSWDDVAQILQWGEYQKDIIAEAKSSGYDGIRFNDVSDEPSGRGSTHLTVFDPKNIRSVNAAFDPSKSDSANLLAGKVYGVPQYQKEEEKIPYWLKF